MPTSFATANAVPAERAGLSADRFGTCLLGVLGVLREAPRCYRSLLGSGFPSQYRRVSLPPTPDVGWREKALVVPFLAAEQSPEREGSRPPLVLRNHLGDQNEVEVRCDDPSMADEVVQHRVPVTDRSELLIRVSTIRVQPQPRKVVVERGARY